MGDRLVDGVHEYWTGAWTPASQLPRDLIEQYHARQEAAPNSRENWLARLRPRHGRVVAAINK